MFLQSDQQSEKKLLSAAALLWVCKQHAANNILLANDPITLFSEIYILIFQMLHVHFHNDL